MRDLNVSFVGAQFNRWFPITMVVYTILLVFEVQTLLLLLGDGF